MTNTIKYWIQKADLSAQDFQPITSFEAVKIFQNYDWNSELSNRRQLEEDGKDFCDPGIGFVSSDQRILHVCPLDSHNAYFHYHFMKQSKFLGLIPNNHQVTYSNMRVEINLIREAIENFYVNNHNWLLEHSQSAG
jgi:hypothetical protein